jgi:hypothetical protein
VRPPDVFPRFRGLTSKYNFVVLEKLFSHMERIRGKAGAHGARRMAEDNQRIEGEQLDIRMTGKH